MLNNKFAYLDSTLIKSLQKNRETNENRASHVETFLLTDFYFHVFFFYLALAKV